MLSSFPQAGSIRAIMPYFDVEFILGPADTVNH